MPTAKQFDVLRTWMSGVGDFSEDSLRPIILNRCIDYGRIRRFYNTGELLEELTKEQEQYFKNSKVRDSKGNLLVVYHGTHSPGFMEFNPVDKDSKFGKYKFDK